MSDDVWEEQSYYPQTDPRTLFGDERLAGIAELVSEHLSCLEPDQSWDTMDTVTLIAAHMIDKGMLRGPKLPPLPEDSQPEPKVTAHRPGPSDDGVCYCEICDYCWPCPTVAPTPSRPRRSGSGTP